MTLILTLLTPFGVLQVSDRLVTKAGQPFDPLSNKNVIYEARDAIVSIGYTGRAYLGGTPTDQWIAEKLRGEIFTERWAMHLGRARHHLDIGSAIELIRSECEREFGALRDDELTRQEFVVGGWQWNRKGARPTGAVVSNSIHALRTFEIDRLPRHWHYETKRSIGDDSNEQTLPSYARPRRFWVIPVPEMNPLMRGDLRRLSVLLTATTRNPNQCERLLVKAIRLAATYSPFTGLDCMSILLPHPKNGTIRARYIPVAQEQVMIEWGDRRAVTPVGFSPWVVGEGVAAAPSIIAHASIVHTDNFRVDVMAPPLSVGSAVRSGVWSQPRPADPSR